MGETWRQIQRFPFYEVSSDGAVRSWRKRRYSKNKWATEPHLLKWQHSERMEYPAVTLCRDLSDGRIAHVKQTVHSLVAAAFLGERPEGFDIAHLNGDTSDASVTNLAYATKSENESHKLIHGTRSYGEGHHASKLKGFDVAAIKYLLMRGRSQASLAEEYEVSHSTLNALAKGKTWKHGFTEDPVRDLAGYCILELVARRQAQLDLETPL